MQENFFKITEDLNKIIEENLEGEELQDIRQIVTGWTNIVFEVTTNINTYFFRFPRGEFWSKMIVKDAKFCEFIFGKTSFKTPEMKLCYDKDRPFSMHKKIEGICFTECIEKLNEEEMTKIAEDISKFIFEISSINVDKLPKECEVTLLDFLDELANRHFDDISLWQFDYVKSTHIDDKIVHGDLNPGNIILDNEYNVIGVIDFCFAGIGNPYADISRVIGRSPDILKKPMIEKYEKQTGEKIDYEMLNRFVKVWSDIEKGYISYIRNNNPDIKLPVMF